MGPTFGGHASRWGRPHGDHPRVGWGPAKTPFWPAEPYHKPSHKPYLKPRLSDIA